MWRKETLADKLSLQVKQSAKKKVYTSTILTDILLLPHSPEWTFLSFLPVLQASTSRLHSFGYVLPSDPQTGRQSDVQISLHTQLAEPFTTLQYFLGSGHTMFAHWSIKGKKSSSLKSLQRNRMGGSQHQRLALTVKTKSFTSLYWIRCMLLVISIHTLSDLVDSNNLIGSLSRTRWWI